MISVLTLGLIERLINTAISSDPTAPNRLAALTGKSLRVVIDRPAICLDVIFCDNHVRFEPVSQSLFEPQGGVAVIVPDCTLAVGTPSELIALMRHQGGNLPITGDHKVLINIKALVDNFSPDVLDKIEPLIGKSAASYAHLIAQELSPIVSPVMSSVKSLFADILTPNRSTQTADYDNYDELISQKKQELLRLHADIEREQARLNALQNQP